MVYFGDSTDPAATSTDTQDELSLIETADRISTIMRPFLDVLTVLVQTLTAYTLIKKL